MAKRVFYASHAVGISGASGTMNAIPGVQSVSINTNFNLEQVFQLGRLAIYDNIAVDPDVEVTINKALDGHDTIWKYATGGGSLVENANDQCTIQLGIGEDTSDVLGLNNAGAPVANISCIAMTGCFINSVNYTIPVDGNFTEEVTFVGSHKGLGGKTNAPTQTAPNTKVLRRQHFIPHDGTNTILPTEIRNRKLSQVTISADFGREKMFALGQASPFHRFVNFPLEITAAFDVIADGTDATGPTFDQVTTTCVGFPYNRQAIKIGLCIEGANFPGASTYTFDLGSGCGLQSVSYSGGDTGGGNVTETYTYITYNTLTITG